jgi:hypothetical protein
MNAPPGPAPATARWAAIGALSAGIVGGIVGLVLGLLAHPATAWFAIIEVGMPAAVVGAVLGLASGAVADVTRRRRDRSGRPEAGGSQQS